MEFRNFLNFLLCLGFICLSVARLPFVYTAFAAFSISLVAVRLADWAMTVTRKYVMHEKVNSAKKAVLITGCDTGFGNSLARKLDELGYTVYAGCLFPDGEDAKNLSNRSSKNLHVVPLDVTSDESVQKAKEYVNVNLGDNVLWAIVNNAGIGQVGFIDWTSIEELQRVYSVNTEGIVRVTKAFLPFLKKSRGRIVNTVSFAGRLVFPYFVGYSMSKYASIALTDGLRIELACWGIKAISIEPYFYLTRLTGPEAVDNFIEKSWKSAPEDIKDDYGEDHKDIAKAMSRCFLNIVNNPNLHEVVDCLEDAVTSKEPLPTYFPCSIGLKALLTLMLLLPVDAASALSRTGLALFTKFYTMQIKRSK